MEGLIASLIGWVATADDIINLQTGLRIRNITEFDENDEPEGDTQIQICFPDGAIEDFTGPDADAILERGESLVNAAIALKHSLDKLAATAQGA